MATEDVAEKDMWDNLNIDYELHTSPGSRVLDVGCGTGIPVLQMLADAGMAVNGCDLAPNMVALTQKRIAGSFAAANMVEYQLQGDFAAILIIYSQLGLRYAEFHTAAFKFAKALRPGGMLVIGQSPSDEKVPENDPAFDETRTYADNFNLPFWGKPFYTLLFSRQGQLDFLRSMGLEIVYDHVDWFKPDYPNCDAEHQQYVIARRPSDKPLSEPKPLPKTSKLSDY